MIVLDCGLITLQQVIKPLFLGGDPLGYLHVLVFPFKATYPGL